MKARLALKVVAVWLGILVLAFVNGTLRELVLIPHWGRTPGLVASGLLLAAAVLLMARLGDRWYGPVMHATQWRIGASWLALTLGFEWTFGWLQHKRLDVLVQAYTFQDGNLWSLVLIVVLVAPRLMGRTSHR